MLLPLLLLAAIIAPTPQTATAPQTSGTPSLTPRHQPNFDAERKQANDLFLAQQILQSLPLYEDLCRQDPTIAVFAERHGAGLLAREATLADPAERQKTHAEAIAEIQRARSLGDDTPYVRAVLNLDTKTPIGAIVSNIPLSVGYTYRGTPQAQATFQQGEAAFGRSDWTAAAPLYIEAASQDPAWYDPPLYAGDMYFRLNDPVKGAPWFAKAIAIDPDRETAYRYWADLLLRSGDPQGARLKYVDAMVAEPYATAPFESLKAWAQRTGHQVVSPAITRPEFITPNGVLKVDPTLAASTQDGRASWIVYQQYRVDHGARTLNQPVVAGGFDKSGHLTPNGYRHTVAEEHAALRAMLADLDTKLASGTLQEAGLDPSLRNLRALEASNVLGAWIAINAADAGIRSDYPNYRANHRRHIAEYINSYLIR